MKSPSVLTENRFQLLDSHISETVALRRKVRGDLMKLAWQNDIGDFIVISVYGNNDNVTLTTYIPYRDDECGNYSPIVLPDNMYFIRKFNNFKQCPIRVTAVNAILYFALKTHNGKVHVSGIDGNV
ncbi:hypothetical protein RR48_07862 [Papilio machaon]|uniref:Uncharacterized protein n=1 Tax=Papilio machaon TaxID=76193 RepID=A0A194QTL0_PAPMA|nr:hypothetical protein RR48_07862 [Papilio machaon]